MTPEAAVRLYRGWGIKPETPPGKDCPFRAASSSRPNLASLMFLHRFLSRVKYLDTFFLFYDNYLEKIQAKQEISTAFQTLSRIHPAISAYRVNAVRRCSTAMPCRIR